MNAHGYRYDLAADQPGACRQDLFLIPDALAGYGHDRIKEWVYGGLVLDGYAVQYLNKVAAIHRGAPPRTTREALNETVALISTSIAVAELAGLVWQSAVPDVSGGQPRARSAEQLAGALKPTRTGWAVPRGGQSMSEASIRWQSEVSGKPYRLVRSHGNTATWEIEEYGYVSTRGAYWFDGRNGNTLVDAKVFPTEWIGSDGRFKPFHARRSVPKIADAARRQITVVPIGV